MKRWILFAVLITFHIVWIGTMTFADAAGPMRLKLPDEVMTASILLFVLVAYQATSWARGAIKEKIK